MMGSTLSGESAGDSLSLSHPCALSLKVKVYFAVRHFDQADWERLTPCVDRV